jgi:hypothetical protein
VWSTGEGGGQGTHVSHAACLAAGRMAVTDWPSQHATTPRVADVALWP